MPRQLARLRVHEDAAASVSKLVVRKRMGIEPTVQALARRTIGFEVN
jgi:hypothetical protein